jgi:hypothetical protein
VKARSRAVDTCTRVWVWALFLSPIYIRQGVMAGKLVSARPLTQCHASHPRHKWCYRGQCMFRDPPQMRFGCSVARRTNGFIGHCMPPNTHPIAHPNNCPHRPRRTRSSSLEGSHWRASTRSTRVVFQNTGVTAKCSADCGEESRSARWFRVANHPEISASIGSKLQTRRHCLF